MSGNHGSRINRFDLGIFIVGAKRTPFGAFCGSLKNHSATELATITVKSALKSASVTPEHVDHVIFGKRTHHEPYPK